MPVPMSPEASIPDRAAGPGAEPRRRWARLLLWGLAGGLGGPLLFLLPDLLDATPIEIRLFFDHPLVKTLALAALMVLGPRRVVGAIPRPAREWLVDRVRRLLRWGPLVTAEDLAVRAAREVAPVANAAAAPLRRPLTWIDGLAARALGGLATAIVAACALLLLTWLPNYLTWPWWADTDQFAVSAQFWASGVRPFGDLLDFDFPGPIYIHYLLGSIFGWGRYAPFYAVDATFLILLGVALASWSRRLFGSALPGLVGYLTFLLVYLRFHYGEVAQRDWHAPLFVVLGLLALEAWPGRAGRIASALALGFALSYRPQEVVFLPAMALAVDEGGRRAGEPWTRAIRPLAEWAAFAAAALALAYAPLILAGVLDDFVRLVGGVRHTPYNKTNWVTFEQGVAQYFHDPWTMRVLAANVLLAVAGPPAQRRPARTWALALLGVFYYKPMSPFPHAYLDQPQLLIRAVALAPPVAWLLTTRRLPAALRLAAVAMVLRYVLPGGLPTYCRATESLGAIGPLIRGEDPPEAPPGSLYSPEGWDYYRSVIDYVRHATPPRARVANLLWDFPYPAINGPAGRLTPFPAAGGYIYLSTIDAGLLDRYVEILERDPDVLVVWMPGHPNPRFPELDRAVRRAYRVEARFGDIEVWRHKGSGPPGMEDGRRPGRD